MLESVGRVISIGFGDRVLTGVLVGMLEMATPSGCYQWIMENHSLVERVSDSDWARYAGLAKGTQIVLSRERVISELKKNRPDLLGIILNTPGGLDWLDSQLAVITKKLSTATT